jgi:hypothetical protein
MNEEIKERWVSALRSNKYNQTTEFLKDDDGFCCLGVLCELAVEDKVIDPAFRHAESLRWFYEDDYGILPSKVQEWAGLHENPWVQYDEDGLSHYSSLSELNDEKRKTFREIADIIEVAL